MRCGGVTSLVFWAWPRGRARFLGASVVRSAFRFAGPRKGQHSMSRRISISQVWKLARWMPVRRSSFLRTLKFAGVAAVIGMLPHLWVGGITPAIEEASHQAIGIQSADRKLSARRFLRVKVSMTLIPWKMSRRGIFQSASCPTGIDDRMAIEDAIHGVTEKVEKDEEAKSSVVRVDCFHSSWNRPASDSTRKHQRKCRRRKMHNRSGGRRIGRN